MGAIAAVIGITRATAPLIRWLSRPPEPPGWSLLWTSHEVSGLSLDGNRIWAGGTDGLAAFRLFDGREETPSGTPGLSYVRDLLLDRQGVLWIAHSRGIARRANGTWSPATGLASGAFLSLAESEDGRIWAGGEPGLYLWNGTRFECAATREQLGVESVEFLYPDRSVLWIASASPRQGGVIRYEQGRFEPWTHRPGLAHPSVSVILRDRSGALWFGTGFGRLGGASIFRDGAWTTLTKRDGMPGEKVRSVFEDSRGRFWIGSEYDGLALRDNGRSRLFTADTGLAGWEVKEVVEDPNHVYWLATEAGITRIEGGP